MTEPAKIFIPRTAIDAIMQLNIAEVIGEYVKLKHAGHDYKGLCPFHNEKTPSFTVSPAKQMFKCFGCGEGGNVIQFVMKHDRLTFPEAAKKLADRYNIPVQADSGNVRRVEVQPGEAKEFDYIKLPATRESVRGIISRGVLAYMDENFGTATDTIMEQTLKEYGFVPLSEYSFTKPGSDDKPDEQGKLFKVTIKSTPAQPVFLFQMEG